MKQLRVNKCSTGPHLAQLEQVGLVGLGALLEDLVHKHISAEHGWQESETVWSGLVGKQRQGMVNKLSVGLMASAGMGGVSKPQEFPSTSAMEPSTLMQQAATPPAAAPSCPCPSCPCSREAARGLNQGGHHLHAAQVQLSIL